MKQHKKPAIERICFSQLNGQISDIYNNKSEVENSTNKKMEAHS